MKSVDSLKRELDQLKIAVGKNQAKVKQQPKTPEQTDKPQPKKSDQPEQQKGKPVPNLKRPILPGKTNTPQKELEEPENQEDE